MRRSSLLPGPVIRCLRQFDRFPIGLLWVAMTLSAAMHAFSASLLAPIASGLFVYAWHRATRYARPSVDRGIEMPEASILLHVLTYVVSAVGALAMLFLSIKWWLLANTGLDATACLILLGLGISAGLSLSVLMNWRLPLGLAALAVVFAGGLWGIALSGTSSPVSVDAFSLGARLVAIHAVAVAVNALQFRRFRLSHAARSAWWIPAVVLFSTCLLRNVPESLPHHPTSPWWLAGMMLAAVVSVVVVARARSQGARKTGSFACSPIVGISSFPAMALAPVAPGAVWTLMFAGYVLALCLVVPRSARRQPGKKAKARTDSPGKPTPRRAEQIYPHAMSGHGSHALLSLIDEK